MQSNEEHARESYDIKPHTHTHFSECHMTVVLTPPPPPGKTYTMIGRDCSTQSLGVAPTAISWLFKVIEERREKSGARFSVRASAVEVSGREETLTDLLAELASSSAGGHREAPGPAVSLREDPLCGSQVREELLPPPLPINHLFISSLDLSGAAH